MVSKRLKLALACTIYHGSTASGAAFGVDEERAGRWRPADELFASDGVGKHPAVLLVDESMLGDANLLRRVGRHVVFVAADEASERALGLRAHISLARIMMAADRHRLLSLACELSCARFGGLRRRRHLRRAVRRRRELERIGMALMLERNQEQLLQQIVTAGKQITGSDLGGLLLAESEDDGPPRLRAAHVESDTIERIELDDRTIAVDGTSVIGHAAATRKPVVLADAQVLPANSTFALDPSFDERYRYHRRSMLIVPMTDRRDRLVGVLVLINRKSDASARITSKAVADRYVLPYTNREVRLARSLASQAAVSIENTRLYAQIERMLESFGRAAVTAIDQRDPATAGHSLRVAALSTALAEAVNHTTQGAYAGVRLTHPQMRELRVAALLHDFGKIAVREDVLTKAKKLPPVLWERVDARFDLIRRTLELEACRQDGGLAAEGLAADRLAAALAAVARMRNIVRDANEPTEVARRPPPELADIAERRFELPDGEPSPYLSTQELQYLQLERGTLDCRERAEIESHARETYDFLIKIEWTEDLRNVPEYAYGHHEKLNGSGYPRKLKGAEIPLQTRIITLADIFDALTESDRPYKPAVASERALDMLRTDAKAGLLDGDLVQIIVESRCWRDSFPTTGTAAPPDASAASAY
ncbi:MAG TPA: HD domain-containing phosphohydrolase [Gemmatimonadaceae bacterium]|jgi:HD-GYP domain-containing protein (c-di-GMP phosphodiesterase class II)|nr:HD domain-containing phosphohydrolase [Gemmatimonadaceae bacterium]